MAPVRRLIALDSDDLAVISAHVQDAHVTTADILWRPGERRVVIGMRRHDWDQTLNGHAEPQRLIAALRFERVLACKARGFDFTDRTAGHHLLGIEFYPSAEPAGCALLIFADGALRLDLECVECELADLGADEVTGDEDSAAS